ncbi:MAG: HAMP domain-containing protein [Deltaproteobacteria bacterium]|jgi:two-component system nitrogen regulation sensor histidine kinase NtrY|nr:HAMP domain-containing protein [Deltaproteobacteria bacterium]
MTDGGSGGGRTEKDDRNRLKKRQTALLLASVLGLILLVAVQRKLLNLGPGLSSNQGVVTLVSINFSVLILTFLLYLILRGLYRIFFERQDYGSLQTKMVVSFISLSLIPTLLIFYFAYLLTGQDRDTWFGTALRDALESSLSVARGAAEREGELLSSRTNRARDAFQREGPPRDAGELEKLREEAGLDSLEWYGPGGDLIMSAHDPESPPPPPADPKAFQGIALEAEGEPPPPLGELSGRLAAPLPGGGFLLGASSGGGAGERSLASLETELERYRAALGIERPFRVTQLTSLAAVTLIAVFLSIWIGSNLARSLAAPVKELVEGTQRVAQGDLEFQLKPLHQSGEMAQLVTAFNLMTRDLKESYQMLDQRRRFVETVLREVSSGVLVLDGSEKVRTANEAALKMLRLSREDFEEGVPPRARELQRRLEAVAPGAPARIFLELPGGTALSLSARRAPLKGEEGESIGWLVSFDDISDLEKAQRLAAWREVAKRIAHEIKNPLTPVSLAAQRLERRFLAKMEDENDRKVFVECVSVIIRQVEVMRNLVNEFSEFARLPRVSPRPADFLKTVEDSLSLFRHSHPKIEFTLDVREDPGRFFFDPEQMGRVLTNLYANAAAALKEGGRVETRVGRDSLVGVELEIADDGPGLPREVKDKLFEPHAKSATGGQGLGLSIVRTIVNDHGGFVRAEDNVPRGTVITVTLPYRQPG